MLGAKLEAKDENKETPLHIACRNASKEMVFILVKKGANIHARNKNFQDVQTVASENNNQDIKEFLSDPEKVSLPHYFLNVT